MPEKTKQKKADEENERETSRAEQKETGGEADWSEDQQKKGYYYDDAYGYEIYNPDDDDEANCWVILKIQAIYLKLSVSQKLYEFQFSTSFDECRLLLFCF